MLQKNLKAFDIENAEVKLFGAGLINHTWKVSMPDKSYILQKINDNVFKQPKDIAYNIRLIADHLQKNYPGYFFYRSCR